MNALKKGERGQVLVILAFGLVFLAALVGLMIDVGIYTTNNIIAHNNAAVGCVTAAEAYRRGGSATIAFANILQQNGMVPTTYSPNQGTGLGLTRGLQNQGDGSWRAAVTWQQPTGFLGIVGIRDMTIRGRARCVGRDSGGLSPIVVRQSAIEDSLYGIPPEEYSIL